MIKRIGTAAREELERFFGTRVFLDLHVRVKAEWREDDRVLNELGLGGTRSPTDVGCRVWYIHDCSPLNAAVYHRRPDSSDLQAR